MAAMQQQRPLLTTGDCFEDVSVDHGVPMAPLGGLAGTQQAIQYVATCRVESEEVTFCTEEVTFWFYSSESELVELIERYCRSTSG
jgi:hypothetical protein